MAHITNRIILHYLMAPVIARQYYTPSGTSAIPRPTAGAQPLPGVKYISLRVVLELFAGTIGIFVLAVLFWKLGTLFRFLTRGRVVSQKSTPSTRYARTWYGWVSLERHNANKELIRKCWQKLREWTAWKTSDADYSWVWWDPGQKKQERYNQSRRLLRWMPKCLRSYDFTTADEIWNPCAVHEQKVGEDVGAKATSTARMTGALTSHHVHSKIPGTQTTLPRRRSATKIRFAQLFFNPETRSAGKRRIQSLGSRLSSDSEKGLSTPVGPLRSLGSICYKPNHSQYNIPSHRSLSLPCLLNATLRIHSPLRLSASSYESARTSLAPGPHKNQKNTRKYQAWSTRMELETCRLIRNSMCRFTVPPGSPLTEVLASVASDLTSLPGSGSVHAASLVGKSSSTSSAHLGNGLLRRNVPDAMDRTNWHSEPALNSASLILKHAVSPGGFAVRGPRVLDLARSTPARKDPRQDEKVDRKKDVEDKKSIPVNRSQELVPKSCLSTWEVRLVNDLDRRLEWIFNQLAPGRRIFHFALLPNHWLNRQTWVVYDPICRVSNDHRRLLGDNRFNVPYPKPELGPKPKYPQHPGKKAHQLRMDSWRLAVNRQRRSSGLVEILKSVEHHEGSAEEPPDGHVDPACWMLRKPPQGMELSTKQKNAYYEGGAGWQETLSDWQRVRRGYRIRKAVYEGKANRTRVKEIALRITRYYQVAISKVDAKKE